MSLSQNTIQKAQQLALSTCLASWSSHDQFDEVLAKIGQNGSVVERSEYQTTKPEKIRNIIRCHLESIQQFASEILRDPS